MSRLTLLLCFGVALLAARPALAVPGIGDAVPPLEIEQLLNAPQDATVDFDGDLKGKVVVLEFWATWCGPCVATIPHLNELTEQFADDDVQFISINYGESPAVVESFLRRRPIAGWVALDLDMSLRDTFEITSIPRTIIVGRDGRIAADMYPKFLVAEHIQSVLDGEPLDPMNLREVDFDVVPVDREAIRPAAEAWLKPSDPGVSRITLISGDDLIQLSNVDARSLVRNVVNLTDETGTYHPGRRIEIDAVFPDTQQTYDLIVSLPKPNGKAARLLAWTLTAEAFGVEQTREMREVDVYVLMPTEDGPANAAVESDVDPAMGPNFRVNIELTQATPERLAAAFHNHLDRPVVAGFEGEPLDVSFSFSRVNFNREQRKAIIDDELANLGLKLVPGRRELEFVVVRNRDHNRDAKPVE